jgi:CHAD domain-containing protein
MSIAPERFRLVFQKLERDLVKLHSKQTPESVHGFRTGTRRVQTLLQELQPEPDRNQKRLLKTLGRIRKRAGKVRDLDVQLAALRRLRMPQEPRRKTQLMHQLIALRAEQEKKLRKLLTKESAREVRKRLKRAARDLKPASARDPLAVARAILARVDHPTGTVTEDILHQYRIAGKRARYAAEFAPPSPEADRFIAQLKRAQDALGDWHDWLTLSQTAAKRFGDVRESSLVAVLHNVTGAKFRNAVSALAALRSSPPEAEPATPRAKASLREAKDSLPPSRVNPAA